MWARERKRRSGRKTATQAARHPHPLDWFLRIQLCVQLRLAKFRICLKNGKTPDSQTKCQGIWSEEDRGNGIRRCLIRALLEMPLPESRLAISSPSRRSVPIAVANRLNSKVVQLQQFPLLDSLMFSVLGCESLTDGGKASRGERSGGDPLKTDEMSDYDLGASHLSFSVADNKRNYYW
jgi:hypothetical protein